MPTWKKTSVLFRQAERIGYMRILVIDRVLLATVHAAFELDQEVGGGGIAATQDQVIEGAYGHLSWFWRALLTS